MASVSYVTIKTPVMLAQLMSVLFAPMDQDLIMASASLAWTLLNIARDAQVQRFVISATQILLDLMKMDSAQTVFKDGLRQQTRPIRTASAQILLMLKMEINVRLAAPLSINALNVSKLNLQDKNFQYS